MLAVGAVTFVQQNGWTLYYGDAESHLDIARRIVDSRTPGYDQVGTAWLPLPHFLMTPFVVNNTLWRTGLAGAIPSAACFVLAGTLLFAAAQKIFHSSPAAIASIVVFAFNPNILYLASTPMTECVFFLGLLGMFYAMAVFRDKQSWWPVLGAGAASWVASLTRYEGWFLIPFVAAFFLVFSRRQRVITAIVFGSIAALAPLYWLAHNQYYFGDALAFYHGPYSAKAIQGTATYPGENDWAKAWLYYRSAAETAIGWAPVLIATLGICVAAFRRIWWPVAFLLLAPVFYVWSVHSSGVPIKVPQLWPGGYYNTRYGLSALPFIALCAGAAVLIVPARWRGIAVIVIGALAVLGAPQRICWKESQVNSQERRAWTHQAAQFMKEHYQSGAGIFSALGDLAGIYREAGIPLREVLQDGNNPAWDAALARPDLFLHEKWAIAIAGDKVSETIRKASQSGPHYQLAESIMVKDAPPIEIYRRNDK